MSEAPFTDSERSRIKNQLSYANWESVAPSINLGLPQGNQFAFLVDATFSRIAPEARPIVRKYLHRCECTEEQIFGAQERLQASKLGDISTNPAEIEKLESNLNLWRKHLADSLGVWQQPYSNVVGDDVLGGSISGKVSR